MEDPGSITYDSVLLYASGYLNTLLWFHYLILTVSMVLPYPFVLHVLRSPDGASITTAIGRVSVQEAASLALSSHYTQFPAQHKETRGYKRRAELISGTEEAFTLLRRVPYECPAQQAVDSSEAARALFPHIIQPLQKYLKTTCQHHTMDSIIKHLTTTIMYGMAPRAFLQNYLSSVPLLQDSDQNWSLSSDTCLVKNIKEGVTFQLRQGEVILLCTVISPPQINIAHKTLRTKNPLFGYQGTRESPV